MKPEIHPEFVDATISCACGNEIHTKSIKQDMRIDICSKCHPFYTGQRKLVDTEGRVEKFLRRYNLKPSGEEE